MSQYHSHLRIQDFLYFKNLQHNRKEIVSKKTKEAICVDEDFYKFL